MPYVLSRSDYRHHAKLRTFKRRAKRGLLLLAIVLLATYVLNFFFSFSDYMPNFYEPKDFERELQMEKQAG